MPAEPKEPDWDKLGAIAEEMEGLIAADAWTLTEYQRIRDAAIAATNGHGEFAEFVYSRTPSSWPPATKVGKIIAIRLDAAKTRANVVVEAKSRPPTRRS